MKNQTIQKDFSKRIKAGERFLRAIRKELGHNDSSMSPGEVLATMLKPEDKQAALDACKGEVSK